MRAKISEREKRFFQYGGAIFCAFLSLFVSAGPGVASDISERIRAEVEQIRYAGEYFVGEDRIGSSEALSAFYERRNFEPAWKDLRQADGLIGFVRQVAGEGLNPRDYHLDSLDHLRTRLTFQQARDARLMATFELLLTDSLLSLTKDLAFGKLDPASQHPSWNFSWRVGNADLAALGQKGIESGNIEGFLVSVIPDLPIYTRLRAALAIYRRLEENGGWQPIADGETLKPGMKGFRVRALARRLAVTGDLEYHHGDPEGFDSALENAVRRFQHRHGLESDGSVGRQTLEALNVPVGDRIDQIRINLERMRWFLHDLPSTFLVVDIAGFHAYYIKDGEVLWDAKAQVGTPFRQTPSFRSEIKYLVFNPTWTVPPNILAEDTLPTIKKDPAYLSRMNMTVLDRDGKVVDPITITWDKYSGRNFPYMLRQEPGPTNVLGRIKFIFPNRFSVYLHDTPSKNLFGKSGRAFSSGCIRIERPLELAELFLKKSPKGARTDIVKTLESLKPTTVFLPEHQAIMLLYLTAHADEYGNVFFKKDVYSRDKPLLKALGARPGSMEAEGMRNPEKSREATFSPFQREPDR